MRSFTILCLLACSLTASCDYSLLNLEDILPFDEGVECPYWFYADHPRVHCDIDLYNVSLQPDHTVQEHFQVIGKDLSPHISRRYKHGYIALLENLTDVDLIRRDTGFARIEGTLTAEVMPLNLSFFTPYPDEFTHFPKTYEDLPWDEFHPNWPTWPSQELRRQLAPSIPTRLPPGLLRPFLPLTFEEANSPWIKVAPDEYDVELQPGHHLQDHFSVINKDLSARVTRRSREDPEMNPTAGYSILLEDIEDLNLIRTDSGVTWVRQAVYGITVRNEVYHDTSDGVFGIEEARKLDSQG